MRAAHALLLALSSLVLGGCAADRLVTSGAALPDGARLIIGPAAATLTPGLTQQLLVVAVDRAGVPLGATPSWTSSDAAVASVTADGLVTARALGRSTMTTRVGTLAATVRIVVQAQPVTTAVYVDHPGVTATVFWVGEGADASNGYISNAGSAFDAQWLAHFGGVDAPTPRRGYLPAGFTPLENPFYAALPYSDFDDQGSRKHNASLVIPWSGSRSFATGESMVKNRWLRVAAPATGRVCYAQWEDAGPGLYDDFQYVFGSAAPANPFLLDGLAIGPALDISPAVRDCLGPPDDVLRLDWRFVDEPDVPAGPWTALVTRR